MEQRASPAAFFDKAGNAKVVAVSIPYCLRQNKVLANTERYARAQPLSVHTTSNSSSHKERCEMSGHQDVLLGSSVNRITYGYKGISHTEECRHDAVKSHPDEVQVLVQLGHGSSVLTSLRMRLPAICLSDGELLAFPFSFLLAKFCDSIYKKRMYLFILFLKEQP